MPRDRHGRRRLRGYDWDDLSSSSGSRTRSRRASRCSTSRHSRHSRAGSRDRHGIASRRSGRWRRHHDPCLHDCRPLRRNAHQRIRRRSGRRRRQSGRHRRRRHDHRHRLRRHGRMRQSEFAVIPRATTARTISNLRSIIFSIMDAAASVFFTVAGTPRKRAFGRIKELCRAAIAARLPDIAAIARLLREEWYPAVVLLAGAGSGCGSHLSHSVCR